MEARRDIFQAIADPTRRAILGLLAFQAMTPGAIAENFDSSRHYSGMAIKIRHQRNPTICRIYCICLLSGIQISRYYGLERIVLDYLTGGKLTENSETAA